MRLLLLNLCIVLSSLTAVAANEVAEESVNPVVAASEQAPAAEATATVETKSEDKVPAVITDNRAESEIPVNLQNNKKAESGGSTAFRIIFSLSILGIVGFGAFIFLRKYSVPKASKHQTQIKVLQQHYLGPKKSLAIIRVAGESILVGITDHNINLIKSLSLLDDEVPEEAPQKFNSVMTDFDEDTEIEEASRPARRSSQELDKDEEFAISGIKDIVSKRLKGMRSFQ